MGFDSIWHWLIVLAIVLVIFGTKKLRNMGSDLGTAIRNFKQAMKEEEASEPPAQAEPEPHPAEASKLTADRPGRVLEGEVTAKTKHKA